MRWEKAVARADDKPGYFLSGLKGTSKNGYQISDVQISWKSVPKNNTINKVPCTNLSMYIRIGLLDFLRIFSLLILISSAPEATCTSFAADCATNAQILPLSALV